MSLVRFILASLALFCGWAFGVSQFETPPNHDTISLAEYPQPIDWFVIQGAYDVVEPRHISDVPIAAHCRKSSNLSHPFECVWRQQDSVFDYAFAKVKVTDSTLKNIRTWDYDEETRSLTPLTWGQFYNFKPFMITVFFLCLAWIISPYKARDLRLCTSSE